LRYVFVVLFTFIFIGCVSKEIEVQKEVLYVEKEIQMEEITENIEIYDLVNIPQDVSYYTQNIDDTTSLYKIQKKFEKFYFRVWNISKPPEKLTQARWPFYAYKYGNSYGENLQLIPEEFFKRMEENSNFDSYGTVNKKAIMLYHSNIRSFPTIKPLLRDPSIAGEGFPFDYLQNSSIQANKPVFISHYSKDKEWVFIFSSFASGWVKANEIVLLGKKYTDLWQKAQQLYLIKEDIPLYTLENNFLFTSKIGMMLALIDEDEKNYTALAVSKYKNNKPLFVKVKIGKDIASKKVLNFTKDNLNQIISEVSRSNYGWGGMYGQRDCSSTLRDIFAPFGIWLPRNSFLQSKVGKVIGLEALSDEGKIKVIKEKAIPFKTLLYKKGHIVLYVGTYNDEIIVFHNAWGIKTKKDGVDGRVVIGKSIFSTLKLGENQRDYDKEGEILRNLKSMNILTL